MDTEFAAALRKLGLRIEDVEETFKRSSGPGGQNVNKVSTSVTLVHRPSGLQVSVQDHRSQLSNRQLARERLIATIKEQRAASRAALKSEREKVKRANRPKPRGLKERILQQKKRRGDTKKMRGRVE
ncbi:MAG: peptide chain release factor-like protein [Chthoniobacterales bacterium]